MKQIKKSQGGKGGKYAIVAALFAGTAMITASGVWFTVYSIANNVSLMVLSNSIPGFVLGALVAYLGFRYFLLVRKLARDILKDSAFFSWSNFRRAKPVGSR